MLQALTVPQLQSNNAIVHTVMLERNRSVAGVPTKDVLATGVSSLCPLQRIDILCREGPTLHSSCKDL
ncbi:hypothetical protein MAM1_0207c08005 [Mucor ambiguus]|uniref:Uncharacterized protein n=1 Tax=Mucor ambiguus TaxID=91626 RepID=A0A0C9N1M7_9FUNG|nr:hypothetical protein MAM1_0207c08005 [Mucor ambiguus]